MRMCWISPSTYPATIQGLRPSEQYPNGDIRIADRVVVITDSDRMNQASGVPTTSELRKTNYEEGFFVLKP